MKLIIFLTSILIFQFTHPIQKVEPVETVCLSKEERKIYDLIMEYRASKKLKTIPLSAKLSQVAQAHVHDLNDNYTFDRDNKCNPHSWSNKGKWSDCCYTADHKQAQCMWDKPQEIAGYDGAGYEMAYYSSDAANAKEGVEGWKHSPSHNPMMINSDIWEKIEWQAIGVGIYKHYAVVWFGATNDTVTPGLCK